MTVLVTLMITVSCQNESNDRTWRQYDSMALKCISLRLRNGEVVRVVVRMEKILTNLDIEENEIPEVFADIDSRVFEVQGDDVATQDMMRHVVDKTELHVLESEIEGMTSDRLLSKYFFSSDTGYYLRPEFEHIKGPLVCVLSSLGIRVYWAAYESSLFIPLKDTYL